MHLENQRAPSPDSRGCLMSPLRDFFYPFFLLQYLSMVSGKFPLQAPSSWIFTRQEKQSDNVTSQRHQGRHKSRQENQAALVGRIVLDCWRFTRYLVV